MKKKIMSLLLAAAMLSGVITGCGKSAASSDSDLEYIKGKGKLIVGITDFAPMDYQDDNDDWIGFDADLARAVAADLGV